MKAWLIFPALIFALTQAWSDDELFKPIENQFWKLPAGVPRTVNTNGEVIDIEFMFTTDKYQEEAFKLVIQEANKVVADLGLTETRPIVGSNITQAFIVPFAHAFNEHFIGNIRTTNYWYFVKRDYKFSDLSVANYDDYFVKYRDKNYQVPLKELNTNAAYQLATQWLTAAHMDVPSLNRDGEVRIELSTDLLPGFAESTEKKTRKKITPLYSISWVSKKTAQDRENLASVELFLPKKQLLQLNVNDPKYILRPPVTFTNLESLFPGNGIVTTNHPSPPKIIDGSGFGQ